MKPSKTDEPGMGARNKPRVTQACDVCSKKKSKCDGAKPSCCVCTQAGNQCTYTRSTKKRGPPPGYFSGIMNRLKHLESIIADTEGPCDPVSMANGDTSVKLGAATADTTTAADTTTTADTTTNTQTQFDTEVLLSRLEAYLNVQKPCPPSYEQDVNVGLANIATNGQSQSTCSALGPVLTSIIRTAHATYRLYSIYSAYATYIEYSAYAVSAICAAFTAYAIYATHAVSSDPSAPVSTAANVNTSAATGHITHCSHKSQ
ncbi:hypothetical protein BASA62_007570 [Batrachochytrium salamandrivorans]|nr:hypothetical protein BASA62_007570 [Batrachochytrium salamandrivorans]